MSKRNFLAVSLLLFSSVLWAQIKPLEFQEFDLDNGLHVILYQDIKTPIVSVSVMYAVGSRNERADRTGFAHFFEHLMFEGTDNIPRGQYDKYVENSGGELNANTSSDRTYYYEVMPSNQLELALWLESERMLHPKVDSIGIQTQKKVVIEEKKQSYDNRPYGTLFQEIMKRAYTVHPYRWTTIGNPADVMAAKDEEFREFHAKFYRPNNATLVIAGDINYQETKAMVQKYFSDIPRGTENTQEQLPIEPPLKAEVKDSIYDNVQIPLIALSYRIPAVGTPDYFAVEMLSSLLSNGQSSRLYKSLVDRKQMAMEIGSFPMEMADPGIAIIYALPNQGVQCSDLQNGIDAEIKLVQDSLLSDNEFIKLKNSFEMTIVSNRGSIERKAETLAFNHVFLKNACKINQELDNYLAVSREDIQRVANAYFTPSNRVVLYYLPKAMQPTAKN